MTRRQKRGRLVEKHGSSLVLSKKWCLRGLGLIMIATGLAAILLGLALINTMAWSVGIGVAFLIVAEFTPD